MAENKRKAPKQEEVKRFPYEYETEQALLCCILTDGDAAAKTVPEISEDYFYNERHKHIYKAALTLFNADKPIDIITVNEQLERNAASDVDMLDYLKDLTSAVPSSANKDEYVATLYRNMVLRRLIAAGNAIIDDAYKSADELNSLSFAEQQIYSISEKFHRGGLVHFSKVSAEFLREMEKHVVDKTVARGLKTYFPTLDYITNGLQSSNLIILAARPSVGKTSFALNILSNMIIANKSDKAENVVAVFSLEMPAEHIVQRVLATVAEVGMDEITRASFREGSLNNLWTANVQASESRIYIDDTSMHTPASIISKCRRLKNSAGRLDLVIVDYLQLMAGDREGYRGAENKQQEVTQISRMMKLLAMDLKCPVLVLSQMSRSIESRDDKVPKLSDLRESGAIEQDADIVMFLSRENEEERSREEYNVILDIAKHRNGKLGAIRLLWKGDYVKFLEAQDQKINREFPAKGKGNSPKSD